MNFVFETIKHVDNDVHVKFPNALLNASYQFSWLIFSAELVIYKSKCHYTCKSTTPQVTYMCNLTLKTNFEDLIIFDDLQFNGGFFLSNFGTKNDIFFSFFYDSKRTC